MKIEWLRVAERDRESQLDYIGQRSASAAIDIGDAVEKAVRHLGTHPYMGRAGRVPGTRELAVSGTPYVVAYRVEPEVVVVLRLLHGAQQWPSKL